MPAMFSCAAEEFNESEIDGHADPAVLGHIALLGPGTKSQRFTAANAASSNCWRPLLFAPDLTRFTAGQHLHAQQHPCLPNRDAEPVIGIPAPAFRRGVGLNAVSPARAPRALAQRRMLASVALALVAARPLWVWEK